MDGAVTGAQRPAMLRIARRGDTEEETEGDGRRMAKITTYKELQARNCRFTRSPWNRR
jgi:hypothetical protein